MKIPSRSRSLLDVRARKSYVVRNLILPAQSFIYVEGRSGIFLLAAAVLALIWANSPWSETYFSIWHTNISIDLAVFSISKDLQHWINDGLMAIFFFVVGLEIKREFVHGELKNTKDAILPVFAAMGGMIFPFAIYFALNFGQPGESGWAIPMATDIAFALGVLALLGNRIPSSLRIFLLTFAIVDDVGAIAVIAIFYSESIVLSAIAAAVVLIGILLLMNRSGVRHDMAYLLIGIFFWLAVLKSGIHATIAGVILGLLIPYIPRYSIKDFESALNALLIRFRLAREDAQQEEADAVLGEIEELSKGTESPLERFERLSHPWASYFVIPLFALANAGVILSWDSLENALGSMVTYGIIAGLLIGKLIGIVGFSWVAVKLKIATLPTGCNWNHILGAGMLAGIGFTVALFISGLAFVDEIIMTNAKIGILLASLLAGTLGYLILRFQVGKSDI
jgi:NhaA family Na+:H+ antiporter